MVNQQLLDFIKMQLEKGVDKELISTQLLSNDWTRQDIEEGFQAVGITTAVPTPTTTSTLNYNQPITNNGFSPDPVFIEEKHHTGRKIFLTILILCALGGAVYYFKSELLNLPFVQSILLGEKIAPNEEQTILPIDTNENNANTDSSDSGMDIFTSTNLGVAITYPKKLDVPYGSKLLQNEGIVTMFFALREEGNKIYITGNVVDVSSNTGNGEEYFIEFFEKEASQTMEVALDNQFLKTNVEANKACVLKSERTKYYFDLKLEYYTDGPVDICAPGLYYGPKSGTFVAINDTLYMFQQSAGQEPYFGLGSSLEFWPPVIGRNLQIIE